MKHFMPFSEDQLTANGPDCDRLVPYQVGMSCLEWYIIAPEDDSSEHQTPARLPANDD